jgi:hypothetical protein
MLLSTKKSPEILTILREYNCVHQLRISQYTFLSNKRHKELRLTLEKLLLAAERENKADGSSASNSNIPDSGETQSVADLEIELKKKLAELENYLSRQFSEIFRESFSCVKKYWEARSAINPRLCVKGINSDYLFVLERDSHDPAIPEDKILLSENSAFSEIASGKDFFLCNDIPKAVSLGTYKNGRIDSAAASIYRRKVKSNTGCLLSLLRFLLSFLRLLPSKSSFYPDKEWRKCWKLPESGSASVFPDSAFYKSTLVIPMSFKTDNMEEEFIDEFQVDSKLDRAIFGFLCFDHPEIDAFNRESDVEFGYILADTLSQYLILQLTHTQFSTVYSLARNKVGW